jgi:hypothetical protein
MIVTRQPVTHIRELCRFELIYSLQGKPDTHETYFSHQSTYASHTLPTSSPRT